MNAVSEINKLKAQVDMLLKAVERLQKEKLDNPFRRKK